MQQTNEANETVQPWHCQCGQWLGLRTPTRVIWEYRQEVFYSWGKVLRKCPSARCRLDNETTPMERD
jgi:hypothetical protein